MGFVLFLALSGLFAAVTTLNVASRIEKKVDAVAAATHAQPVAVSSSPWHSLMMEAEPAAVAPRRGRP